MGKSNNPVHVTDFGLSQVPQYETKQNLLAAEILLQSGLVSICGAGLSDGSLSLRNLNGIFLPSIYLRHDISDDGGIAIATQLLHQAWDTDLYGMRTNGVGLDIGFGKTASPELHTGHIASRSANSKSVGRLPHIVLGLEPGNTRAGEPGNVGTTRHPFFGQTVDQLGGVDKNGQKVRNLNNPNEFAACLLPLTTRKLFAALPELRVIDWQLIAPTPGTVDGILHDVLPQTIKGSKGTVVLSGLQVNSPGIIEDRTRDLEALRGLMWRGRAVRKTFDTNQLQAFQAGSMEDYSLFERLVLNGASPFDSKYTSTGARQDKQESNLVMYRVNT